MEIDGTSGQHTGRVHGLDALRGVLMLLGIGIHVVLSYIPSAGWPFTDPHASAEELGLFSDGIHLFRMPAFFLLSGFFGALLWQRRGPKLMLENRFNRIVLPFVVFVVLLDPFVDASFSFAASAANGGGDPWNAASEAFREGSWVPDGTMHLWFLYDLIFITAVGAAVVWLMRRFSLVSHSFLQSVRRTVESPWRSVAVFGLINFAWCAPQGWDGIPTTDSWWPSPDILFYYLICYGLGWMIFASETALSSFEKRAKTLLFVGFCCVLVRGACGLHMEGLGFEEPDGVAWPFEYTFCVVARLVSSSVGLVALTRGSMGLFLQIAGSGSARWRYISDSSYWVYLVHLHLSVLVPALIMDWPLPVWIKFPLSMVIVALLCWLSYDVMVRATSIGRFLNGRKYPSGAWKLSALGLVLATGCIGYSAVTFVPMEPLSPWRGGKTAQDLLEDESVVDPFVSEVPDVPVVPGVDLEHCIGVQRYAICAVPADYKSAFVWCAVMGGGLANLETEAENKMVAEWIRTLTEEPFRVAVTDAVEDGRWVWMDGTELNYDPWDEGQPDNYGGSESCAGLNWGGAGLWHDIPCDDYEIGFICEFSE